MNKKNEIETTANGQQELSLPELAARIKERESKIDITCTTAIKFAMDAVNLAIDQGGDLLLARHKTKNASRGEHQKKGESKGWQKWLQANFPKSDETARKYMDLAIKVKTNRDWILQNDIKTLRDAFRALYLIPEVEPEQRQLPSITVAPIISRLNFVAEWVTKSADEITSWEQIRRDELKLQLKPVVELFEKL